MGDPKHKLMVRAVRILTDRQAEQVLADAQKRKETDALLAKRCEEQGKAMQVGPASKMADKIDEEIAAAAEKDVPRNDPRLVAAEKIGKELREADGLRVRLAAREQRLAEGKAKAKP